MCSISYKDMGLNVIGVDAKEKFWNDLKGVTEPEQKRKIIGRDFIEVFDVEAHKIQDVKWLAQGTIYPDVIESVSVNGPSATIKSHHNVGGLPEKMHLKVVEPLKLLFKDEVRRVGKALDIKASLLGRHPFPGPGLGIRILSDITPEKVRILQEADAIFINTMKEWGLYDDVWQAGVMLLPVQSVGVMGDERTYENVVALRAVASTDGMTADWVHLPYDFLAKVSNDIINKVRVLTAWFTTSVPNRRPPSNGNNHLVNILSAGCPLRMARFCFCQIPCRWLKTPTVVIGNYGCCLEVSGQDDELDFESGLLP